MCIISTHWGGIGKKCVQAQQEHWGSGAKAEARVRTDRCGPACRVGLGRKVRGCRLPLTFAFYFTWTMRVFQMGQGKGKRLNEAVQAQGWQVYMHRSVVLTLVTSNPPHTWATYVKSGMFWKTSDKQPLLWKLGVEG